MGGGPPCFTPGFTCPVLLWCHLIRFRLRLRDFYLLRSAFPGMFDCLSLQCWWSATPYRSMVWALSLSLAATQEIDVSFSSSGYLDVSVHRVTFVQLWIGCTIHTHYHMWVSPFGDLWINGYVRLPTAYRSLSRPSSAPVAKASTMCSYSLDLFWSLGIPLKIFGKFYRV